MLRNSHHHLLRYTTYRYTSIHYDTLTSSEGTCGCLDLCDPYVFVSLNKTEMQNPACCDSTKFDGLLALITRYHWEYLSAVSLNTSNSDNQIPVLYHIEYFMLCLCNDHPVFILSLFLSPSLAHSPPQTLTHTHTHTHTH